MTFPGANDKDNSSRVVKVEMRNFLSSTQAETLEGSHKDSFKVVIRRFLESVYIYHDSAPMELSASDFRQVVLETLPRCFGGEEQYLDQVPDIVAEYVDYLDERSSVKDAVGFQKAIGEMRKKFAKAVKKVKPDDRLMTDETGPLKSEKGKPGRNDPCPCGSGKKYKKCCQLKAK